MQASRPQTLLQAYDAAPLTPRYWIAMGLVALQSTFDYFDFFVVSYLIAVLAPVWHLTYGQSATMLVGGGLGAIIGAMLGGAAADRFGRKPALISSIMVVAAGSAALTLVPDGAWLLFAVMRILVGIGLGGAASAQTAITVELTPTRHRTFMSSIMVAPTSLGIILAALLSSQLLPLIGWRGLAAAGVAPGLVGVVLLWALPESPRWLLSRGAFARARQEAAKQLGVPPATLPLPAERIIPSRRAGLRALLERPRAFWLIVITWLAMSTVTYGYQLWAPTILALAVHLPVRAVAGYFTVVGVSGLIGRFVFSALPVRIGRRRSGQVMAAGATVFVLLAGTFHTDSYGGIPAFIVWLTLAAVFVNGGFSNMAPYAPESYPVHLGGSASALSQAVNGVGKMLGPLCLGLIAGSGNVVAPAASEAAVIPAFAFMSACCVLAGLAYTLLPIETHGVPLAVGDEGAGLVSTRPIAAPVRQRA